jgi:cytidylate kinase
MHQLSSSGITAEALLRASQHWQTKQRDDSSAAQRKHAFTIAISREAGARGTSVARALGEKLGWPVYDHELLELIAKEMNLRTRLLQSVDERHVDWLQDTMAGFSLVPNVSQSGFVRHLVETMLSLAAHGSCIIVGRGSPHVLPVATTLRVRLVAPLEDRVGVMSHQLHMTRDEAARHVKTIDQQRSVFVKDHFRKDTTAPENYDLVLNASRFSVRQCAEVIVDALHRFQEQGTHQHAAGA